MYKAGYRRLLKSVIYAFQNDAKAVGLAREQLRKDFYKNKGVGDLPTLQTFAKDIDDIDEMLRFHIVQGAKGKRGPYEVKFKPEHMTTIEAEQENNPFGPELEPIDRGFVGKDVQIEKSTSKRKPPPEEACSHHNHN